MTRKEFKELVDHIFGEISSTIETKGDEYANDKTDQLHNFKRNGKNQDLPPESILMVYASKHWDSINRTMTRLRKLDEEGKDVMKELDKLSAESTEGRLMDLILYVMLLWGLL